ncbi:MAG: hypothetical protein ACI8RZ_004830 [Myxococcota bacterium]|jgi:uncharacterized protein YdiU (UPF0061 family)
MPGTYRPDPRYLDLGTGFADAVEPARFPSHTLRFRNSPWADRIGLGGLSDEAWIEHFARFQPLPDNLPTPLALRYHGHQFTTYNPQLGDGRGFLFAQLRDHRDRLLDLGTKGSGPTPYSRGGDGRLTLKGGIREILASELLEARGVSTCKTLSLIETGESLQRNDEPSPTRSGVMVRLSHSHIRIGTFQRYQWYNDRQRMQTLLDYCIEHFYPQASSPVEFLTAITDACANTAAAWTVSGFVHGVLNTDNINITGESFDYGPWRFLPTLDQKFTAAYFDGGGLYAFGRQPAAVLWALEQLARSLALLGDSLALGRVLSGFEERYRSHLTRRFVQRLGLSSAGEEADRALVGACLTFLDGHTLGYDQFFFDWYGGLISMDRAQHSPAAAFYQEERFQPVRTALGGWSAAHPDRLAHPHLQGEHPCSMLLSEVEALWSAIDLADAWQPLEAKIAQIRAVGALHRGEPWS